MKCKYCNHEVKNNAKFCTFCGKPVETTAPKVNELDAVRLQYAEQLHNWRIVRSIGEGSFGKVYEIQREDFGVTYRAALKIISIPKNQNEVSSVLGEGMSAQNASTYYHGMVEQLVKEFALMSQLKGNSNIVSYEDHQVLEHNDGIGWDILIRMELLAPFSRYVQENEFTYQDFLKVGTDLCKALVLCEKNHIIHRDIKPENIFVSKNGDFKLGDFGVARTIEESNGASTRTGTNMYMAPEVYWGEKYDSTVDTYSLGLVLYWLLNNRRLPFLPPFPEPITLSSRSEALQLRTKGSPITRPVRADDATWAVLQKACAFDRKDRYQTAQEMLTDLLGITQPQTNGVLISTINTGDNLTYRAESTATEIVADDVNATPVGIQAEINPPQFAGAVATGTVAAPSASISGAYQSANEISPDSNSTKGKKKTGIVLIVLVALIVCALIAIAAIVLLNQWNTQSTGNERNTPSESSDVAEPTNESIENVFDASQPEKDSTFDYVVDGQGMVTIVGLKDQTLQHVVIPDTIEGAQVTRIEANAFENCTGLQTVVIPDGVTQIGAKAFSGCSSLQNVTLPNSALFIGESAFSGCGALQGVAFPQQTMGIGASAFENCNSLQSVIIPENIPQVEKNTFSGCTGLKVVTFPAGLKLICEGAFYQCASLQGIDFPQGLNEIDQDAFVGCTALKSVVLPAGVGIVDPNAFDTPALPTPTPAPVMDANAIADKVAMIDAAMADSNGYIFPQSGTKLLTDEDLQGLTPAQLRMARNEIVARHGRKFTDASDVRRYFESKTWYNGTTDPKTFDRMTGVYSDIEEANIALIHKFEGKK